MEITRKAWYDNSMDEMIVILAEPKQKDVIAEIIAEAFWEDFCTAGQPRERVAQALAQAVDPARFVLAICGDEVAGVAACSDLDGRAMAIHSPQKLVLLDLLDEETAFIEFVAVREGFRRRGAAKAMLRQIMENSGKAVYKLTVDEGNTPAIACYESLGFRAFKNITEQTEGQGFREKICMRLVQAEALQ